MSDLIHCPDCKCKKKVVGLGNILKDCLLCKGVGWINKPLAAHEETMDISKVKKKPARKSKETVMHV